MTSVVTSKGLPVYYVAKDGAKAGLILVSEWWGLNNQIKKKCHTFSDALPNCATLSPDLYRGKVATKADEANHLMSNLDWKQAVEDIRESVAFLKSKGCEKVGVVGWCMGGAISIAAGVHVSSLSAASCFYGIPGKSLADPKNLQVPMQFHFGNDDKSAGFSDKAAADALKATIAGLKGQDVSEFHQYDGADHAFMNEEAPAYPYNAEVSKIAFEKTVAFFKKHLY